MFKATDHHTELDLTLCELRYQSPFQLKHLWGSTDIAHNLLMWVVSEH